MAAQKGTFPRVNDGVSDYSLGAAVLRAGLACATLRRNITQNPFTIFNRNAPRLIGLYPLQLLGIAMPICCRPDEKDLEKNAADTWREPPGYLGEAVRRAKRIPSRATKTEPVPADRRD